MLFTDPGPSAGLGLGIRQQPPPPNPGGPGVPRNRQGWRGCGGMKKAELWTLGECTEATGTCPGPSMRSAGRGDRGWAASTLNCACPPLTLERQSAPDLSPDPEERHFVC